jgi:hypothetical protein
MDKETVYYSIEKRPYASGYVVRITRGGPYDNITNSRVMKRIYTETMWGGKRAAKRWIKRWARGDFLQHSYMNKVEVNVPWNGR